MHSLPSDGSGQEFERRLCHRLEGFVPGSAARVCPPDEQYWDELSDAEQGPLNRAVAKRRNEFGAGRRAAREGAAALGVDMHQLMIGAARQPLWPDALVGSISHDALCAVAWVAPADGLLGLGVDLEYDGKLDTDSWRLVFTASELSAIERAGDDKQLPLLLFSAKESLYKCAYYQVRRFVGFKEVSFSVDSANETVTSQLHRPLADELTDCEFAMGYLRDGRRQATWACLRRV